eukprot:TRINITY_DN24135_c0_g2_i1.p1 TRINITY_DN24135_c0_g2~~TRINITY_DN24135_c0_g2_i1.p1  ORF type:complete len:507 (-),score=79.33 TRINITY_DN24135_c0_g2_i1:1-1473(-)
MSTALVSVLPGSISEQRSQEAGAGDDHNEARAYNKRSSQERRASAAEAMKRSVQAEDDDVASFVLPRSAQQHGIQDDESEMGIVATDNTLVVRNPAERRNSAAEAMKRHMQAQEGDVADAVIDPKPDEDPLAMQRAVDGISQLLICLKANMERGLHEHCASLREVEMRLTQLGNQTLSAEFGRQTSACSFQSNLRDDRPNPPQALHQKILSPAEEYTSRVLELQPRKESVMVGRPKTSVMSSSPARFSMASSSGPRLSYFAKGGFGQTQKGVGSSENKRGIRSSIASIISSPTSSIGFGVNTPRPKKLNFGFGGDVDDSDTKPVKIAPIAEEDEDDSTDGGPQASLSNKVNSMLHNRSHDAQNSDNEKLRMQMLARGRSRGVNDSDLDEDNTSQSCATRIIESKLFDMCFILLILFNATVIGAQSQYSSNQREELQIFSVLNYCFAVAFLAELMARIYVCGCSAFVFGAEIGRHTSESSHRPLSRMPSSA